MGADSFVFHRMWWEAISLLPDEERLKAYDEVFARVFSSAKPASPAHGMVERIVRVIGEQLERKAAIQEKRKAAGSMGGRAKAERRRSSLPLTPPSREGSVESGENVNVNVNVNEKRAESVITGLRDNGIPIRHLRQVQGRQTQGRQSEVSWEEFWELYAYKKDRKVAKKAWDRLSPADKEAAIDGIERYRTQCARENRPMMFAQGYLNHRRWEDEPRDGAAPLQLPRGGWLTGTITKTGTRNGNEEKEERQLKRRAMEVTAEKPTDFGGDF